MHYIFFANNSQSLPSCVEVPTFGKCDYVICPLSQSLGLGVCSSNPVVFQKGCYHISEHGFPVTACSAQLDCLISVSHGYMLLLVIFYLVRWLESIKIHTQGETHFLKNFLDFIQGLSTEVFGLEHLTLCFLDKLV